MPAQNLLSPPTRLPDAETLLTPTADCFGLLRIGKREYYIALPSVEEVKTTVRLYHREWDGPWYDVWETEHGLHGCTCRGFDMLALRGWRRPCRHIAAMYLLGFLSRFPPPGCARRPDLSTQLENAA